MTIVVNDLRDLASTQVRSTDVYIKLKEHMSKYARQGKFSTQVDINDAPAEVRRVLRLEGFDLQYTRGMLGVVISWY